MKNKYNLPEARLTGGKTAKGFPEVAADGEIVSWSNARLPEIGGRVNVRVNAMGPGTVRSYFIEGTTHRFIGVAVELDVNPEWRKGMDGKPALVFGAEVDVS